MKPYYNPDKDINELMKDIEEKIANIPSGSYVGNVKKNELTLIFVKDILEVIKKETYSTKEAAEALGIIEQAVRKRIKHGTLKANRCPCGQAWLINKSEIKK